MSQEKINLLSKLLPAHHDLLPILDRIREKYDLPVKGIIDRDFVEFVYSGSEIPWEEIREELRHEIENAPDLWPEPIVNLLKLSNEHPELLTDTDTVMEEFGTDNEQVRIMLELMQRQISPVVEKLQEFVDTTADLLLTWLATGEAADIPYDWVGSVGTMSYFGEPVVFAVAGPFSDPQEISRLLTTKHRELYGRDRFRISREFKNNVEFLRMKFEGVAIKDIADEYIQRHWPKAQQNPKSKGYRGRKRRLEERLKQQLYRQEQTLLKMIGDDKQTN